MVAVNQRDWVGKLVGEVGFRATAWPSQTRTIYGKDEILQLRDRADFCKEISASWPVAPCKGFSLFVLLMAVALLLRNTRSGLYRAGRHFALLASVFEHQLTCGTQFYGCPALAVTRMPLCPVESLMSKSSNNAFESATRPC